MKKIKPISLIIIALFAGFLLRGFFSPAPPLPNPHTEYSAPEIWTCSMHPQIKLPKAGKCPICFMDLIPLDAGSDGGGEREIRISPYAAKLMELETVVVERRFAEAEVRMVGQIDYDETRVSIISAWVPGRIDKLFVDSTGVAVKKGDPLAELYGPNLVTAQEELLQAIKHNPSLVDSAREKLRLWGFSTEQITEIETRGTATDHMTIYAPVGGIVIHKGAQLGLYLKTGTRIYTIADLSKVWIQLDAYESDLHGLQAGSTVAFTTETYPGKTFEGTIGFIDPIVNPATRTAKVRVIVDNKDHALKPGMFVRATVKTQPAGDEPPLLIPATAALKTGKRAVVYVEIPNSDKPTYEGREIRLGMRLGDFYVVESGLSEGERVVTQGAFKLDAELQIQAKPSMMSMPSEQIEYSSQSHREHRGNLETKSSANSASLRGTKPQTLCPVMGGAINKEVFTDYHGQRIYFCCGGCDGTFLDDPDKYLKQMKADGVELEKVNQNHAH